MSIPESSVKTVETPIPGLWHGTVHDDRIDFRSETFAVRCPGGAVVWIDPLPMTAAALERWPEPDAVLLSGRCHQRAAWAFRRRFGVAVWGPDGMDDGDERPDRRFGPGDELPVGVIGHPGIGPTSPHAWFEWPHPAVGRIAYVGDLWIRAGAGPFRPVPLAHREDSPGLLRRLRARDWRVFDGFLTAHGPPCFERRHRSLELRD